MLVIFTYKLARVNKPNVKMQEIAPYNVAVYRYTKVELIRLHVDRVNTAAAVLNYSQVVCTLQRCLIHNLAAI
jgi:hypothetical protein